MTNQDNSIKKIDIREFMEKKAFVTMEALQGLDGWAETDFSVTYSPVATGTNVLLDILQTGSCNTDRSLLVSIQLDKSFNVVNQEYYKVGDCHNFSTNLHKGTYRVISNLFYEKYRNLTYDAVDNSFDIGSYKIVDSKVIVTKAWDYNYRISR